MSKGIFEKLAATLTGKAKRDEALDRARQEALDSLDAIREDIERRAMEREAREKAEIEKEAFPSRVSVAQAKAEFMEKLSKAIKETDTRTSYERPPMEPKVKLFKFVGRVGWAWEVENKIIDGDDVNYYLQNFKKANNLGFKMAKQLFEGLARAATENPQRQNHIEEDGIDVILPPEGVPYSPYSEEGTAFMVSLAYSWRSMAQEWNIVEEQRYKEFKDRESKERAAEISEYLTTSVDAMIKQELARKEQDRNDNLDAMAAVNFGTASIKATDFAKLFGSPVVSEERTGLSKIAAGLAAGDLKKSKF